MLCAVMSSHSADLESSFRANDKLQSQFKKQSPWKIWFYFKYIAFQSIRKKLLFYLQERTSGLRNGVPHLNLKKYVLTTFLNFNFI